MHIRVKKSADSKQFLQQIPEDLMLFFSQNCKEPQLENCEKKMQIDHINHMNLTKRFYVPFGSEKSRADKLHPDHVYLSAVSLNEPISLYLFVTGTKSKTQIINERIQNFKDQRAQSLETLKNNCIRSQGIRLDEKINIDNLGEEHKAALLQSIDGDLATFL